MKKCVALLMTLVLSFSLSITTFAKEEDNTDVCEVIKENIDLERYTVYEVDSDEIPDDVAPLEFDTVDEAIDWVQTLDAATVTTYSDYWDQLGYDFKGDVGYVNMAPIPSGSGSTTLTVTYDVPGLSAQVVTAEHYFEYSNHKVVDWEVYTKVTGIGLATFKPNYRKLERHDVDTADQYFGVCVGDLGYYISVGGQNIGVFEQLELTQGLYYYHG